jgi:hypothetical protein
VISSGDLVEITVAGKSESLYILKIHQKLLKNLLVDKFPSNWNAIARTSKEEVIFLSPLEYVSARGRAKDFFNFDYVWEIYKPEVKRKYGPYTLPILFGDKLVARIDMKHDRKQNQLIASALWLEDSFRSGGNFELALANGLKSLMSFLAVDSLNLSAIPNSSPLKKAEKHLS